MADLEGLEHVENDDVGRELEGELGQGRRYSTRDIEVIPSPNIKNISFDTEYFKIFKFVNQQGEGKSEPLDNTPSFSLYICRCRGKNKENDK